MTVEKVISEIKQNESPESEAYNYLSRLKSTLPERHAFLKGLLSTLSDEDVPGAITDPARGSIEVGKLQVIASLESWDSAYEDMIEQIDIELERLKPTVIKQNPLTDQEHEIISEAIKEMSLPESFFPNTNADELESALRQFYKRVLQITDHENDSYNNLHNHSSYALELSNLLIDVLTDNGIQVSAELLQEFNKTSTSNPIVKILQISAMTLRNKFMDHFPEDENGELDEEKRLEEEITAIDENLWSPVPQQKIRDILLGVWQTLIEDEKRDIVNDPSGFQAGLILSRRLGIPIFHNLQYSVVDFLVDDFNQAIQDANLEDYIVNIPTEKPEDSKKDI